MAKTKDQKKELIEKYKSVLKNNPDYVLVNTDQVTMPQITELKKNLQESNGSFFVVKNTLFKIAAEETGQPVKIQEISAATGVVVFGDEPTEPAKALRAMQKTYKVLDTRFGVIFGDITDADKVQELAEIPSREELLAKLVGTLNSPLTGFMSTARGNVRKFVHALSEIQKSKNT